MIGFLIAVLQGAVVGIANVIPGVSGGTLMVTMGIYDRFVGAIGNITKEPKKSIKTLLPYLLGIVLGIVGLAFAIEFLYAHFPFETTLFFVGLILGGIPIICKVSGFTKSDVNVKSAVLFVLGIAVIVVFTVLGAQYGAGKTLSMSAGSFIAMFVIGAVCAAVMVIPGVSGSLMLMIFGYHEAVVAGLIPDFIKSVIGVNIKAVLSDMFFLVPFGLGVIAGILGISKLLGVLFEKFRALTYAFIMGLVIASPYAIVMSAGKLEINALHVIVGIVVFAVGAFAALFLGRKETSKKDENK